MTKAKSTKPMPRGQQSVPQAAQTVSRNLNKTEAAKPKFLAAHSSGKIGKIITLLRRPKGATIGDPTKATDWQAHSIRGAISGTIKKKLGLAVTSGRSGDVRVYRIAV